MFTLAAQQPIGTGPSGRSHCRVLHRLADQQRDPHPFDRDDITSEEDRAEASRKLEALTGTIAGTTAQTNAEALNERLAKSVSQKGLVVARARIELATLRFSVVCSTN